MSTHMHSRSDSIVRRQLAEPEVRVALVTAVCVLVQAVLAKNVLEVELDILTQLAPFWVFIAFLVSGLRGRAAELGFTVAIVGVTAAVLVLYAL